MDVESILVVEDDAEFANTLKAVLAPRAKQVHSARTVGEAKTLLLDVAPAVVLLDFALPDANADELLPDLLQLRPLPTVIAMSGVACAEDAFRLAQTGVRAFLQKPFDLAGLELVWEQALTGLPDVAQPARQAVGKLPLRAVEGAVRDLMLGEALAMANGSRRRAAGLLRVSRQALQHMLRARPAQ